MRIRVLEGLEDIWTRLILHFSRHRFLELRDVHALYLPTVVRPLASRPV